MFPATSNGFATQSADHIDRNKILPEFWRAGVFGRAPTLCSAVFSWTLAVPLALGLHGTMHLGHLWQHHHWVRRDLGRGWQSFCAHRITVRRAMPPPRALHRRGPVIESFTAPRHSSVRISCCCVWTNCPCGTWDIRSCIVLLDRRPLVTCRHRFADAGDLRIIRPRDCRW